MATKSPQKKTGPDKEPSAAESDAKPDSTLQLKEIRELLFGAQVREVNADIHTLQQDTNTRIKQLTQQMQHSLAELTATFNSRLDDLAKHLESLNSQRMAREDDLAADIDHLRHQLEEAKAASDQADNQLHDRLTNEAERLANELNQRHHEAMERLNQTSTELSSNKADRKTLANLLAGMANNLTAGELE